MTVHQLAGEEGSRTAKQTCGFSTARNCALNHWKDDTVTAAAMEAQRGYPGGKTIELLYGNASNI